MSALHQLNITHNDENRMVFTGILYPDVQAGAGPKHGLIQANPEDTEAYYGDPVIKVNDQDLAEWNQLRGKPLWFEHGKHQKEPALLGQFLDSKVTRDGELFVVAQIDKRGAEGEWAAEKIASGELGELSIGYEIITWPGTNKLREKRFKEGSLVYRGFFPGTKIAVACSKARHYKSSASQPSDTSVDSLATPDTFRFTLMASTTQQAAAAADGSAQTTADAGSVNESSLPVPQSKVSGDHVETKHHSQSQHRASDGRFSKVPGTGGETHMSEQEAVSMTQQLELETRLQKQHAEMEAQRKELEDLRKTNVDRSKDYERLKQEDEERKEKVREGKRQEMEDALAKIKTGLNMKELEEFSKLNKAVAIENNPGAIKASRTVLVIGQKVAEMSGQMQEKDKALGEKDAKIAELLSQLKQANTGRNVMASRIKQARQNLRNTISPAHTPASKGDKGKEEEDADDDAAAFRRPVQASRGLHGSDIGDILIPLPAVQPDSWEGRFMQRQYNPNFGMSAAGTYGSVHASVGGGANGYAHNEYEGRLYTPAPEHKWGNHVPNSMRNTSPAWFAHLVQHTHKLDHLPVSKKYDMTIGERDIHQTYDHEF